MGYTIQERKADLIRSAKEEVWAPSGPNKMAKRGLLPEDVAQVKAFIERLSDDDVGALEKLLRLTRDSAAEPFMG